MLRTGFRLANRILGRAGFQIDRLSADFDCRLTGPSERKLIEGMAGAFDAWTSSQVVFGERLGRSDSAEAVERFYRAYLAAPFRQRTGGSRFNNQLFLHLIAKALSPSIIIDSGTFQGASAWALSTGSPTSRVLSFDVDLSRLLLRQPGVEYFEHDWAGHEIPIDSSELSLCYFDDHLDQVRRLLEAKERGVSFAIFDDDYPITSFALMSGRGAALPKIEFALDRSIRSLKTVEWLEGDAPLEWAVDVKYLERAESAIVRTERLPNTSLITGIHQTPYRIVAL